LRGILTLTEFQNEHSFQHTVLLLKQLKCTYNHIKAVPISAQKAIVIGTTLLLFQEHDYAGSLALEQELK
jgi:hypothetical protein